VADVEGCETKVAKTLELSGQVLLADKEGTASKALRLALEVRVEACAAVFLDSHDAQLCLQPHINPSSD
jgi:hypothetical protein